MHCDIVPGPIDRFVEVTVWVGCMVPTGKIMFKLCFICYVMSRITHHVTRHASRHMSHHASHHTLIHTFERRLFVSIHSVGG
jgi:hypothetical protein